MKSFRNTVRLPIKAALFGVSVSVASLMSACGQTSAPRTTQSIAENTNSASPRLAQIGQSDSALSKLRIGESAFGGYTSDAPGVRRLLRLEDLPKPRATQSVDNGPKMVPRPEGAMPLVPRGFTVSLFASDLANPRKIITAPNGDIFVAESGANRVSVLRPNADGSGVQFKQVFADGLRQPFGLAFYPSGKNPQYLYVGNTDAVVRIPYHNGDLAATGATEHLVDLPGGGRLRGGGHWSRDVVFSQDGKTLYASVGSHSNNDDNELETDRADILSFDINGNNQHIYASGIRNPVGIAIDPSTGIMWTSVNERDTYGDNLVPDYITHVTPGGFYGWPWYYMGGHHDPRYPDAHPELANNVVTPDVLLQPHYASLCLTFYTGKSFPKSYRGGIFAAEHGSWNRKERTGYSVVFVPLKNGKSSGEYDDFLTGMVTSDGNVWGRPVGVTLEKDGSLLVSDDGGNVIWRVTYTGTRPTGSAKSASAKL